MALVLDHVFELGAVLALLLLGLTIGLAIGRRAGVVPSERPVRDLLAAQLLGLSVYATIVLILGLAGLLQPLWLATATGGVAAAVARALPDSARLLRRCSEAANTRRDRIVFGVVGAIAAALLIQSSAPPTDWDSLIYHLEVPRAWLADGSVHLPVDNLHAAFTGLMHLLYVPLLAIDAASGAATLEAVLGCLLAVTLFEFGDRFFDRDTGRIAAVALFGSPAFAFVAMTPRVDVTVVLFLVAALYFLYASAFPDEVGCEADGRSLAAAAALLGLASSVKLLAAPWIVAVTPLAVFALVRRTDGPADTLRTAGLAFGAFLVGAAPGLLLRWHLTGAPLYPALSPRLLEPWLQPWYGGAAVLPPEAVLEQRVSYTREALSLSALLSDPGSLTPEREGGLYFLSPLLLLTPLALLRLRRLKVTWLLVIGAVFVALVLGRGSRTNLRYLLPAVALATLLAAHVLSWAYGRLGPSLVGRVTFGAVLVLAVAPAVLPFTFRWSEMPTFEHLAGAVAEETYLTENEDPDVYLWGRTARWLDRRLSPEDRVLLLFEGRGFHLETRAIQDNLLANWPLLAPRLEPGDCLARAGVSHVLVNYGVLDVHLTHGMPPRAVAWSAFPAFARRCLRREAVRYPYVLYSVVDRGGQPHGTSADTREGEES